MESAMRAFFYSSEIEGKGKEILEVMEELFQADQLVVIRSIDSLSRRLREPWEKKPIAVVLASKKDELVDFVFLREQLHPIRLILVLPDAEAATISLAHRLHPNYLTYVHGNMKELRAVLQKMLAEN
jgi:hypothetical protein